MARLAPQCPTLEHVIVLDGAGSDAPLEESGAKLWLYEDLLAKHGEPIDWGQFDEEPPAGLCYTSGTTGSPKGVLYTHRSNYLHTLRALQADAMAITPRRGPCSPFRCFMQTAGACRSRHLRSEQSSCFRAGTRTGSLAALMREEGVTIAVGVQTVWLGVVEHLMESGGDLPDLERVIIGGSSCPDALIRRMEERLGARVQTSWG